MGKWVTIKGHAVYLEDADDRPAFAPDHVVRPTDASPALLSRTRRDYSRHAEAYARHPLPAAEEAAVREYTKGDFAKINLALRAADPAPGSTAARLAAAIARQPPTAEDVTVHRFVDHAPAHAPGTEETWRGFTSASLQPTTAFERASPVAYEIHVPRGSRGVLVGHNPGEREVVFNHGARFQVLATKRLRYDVGSEAGPREYTVHQLRYVG